MPVKSNSKLVKHSFKYAIGIAPNYRTLTVFEGKNSATMKIDIPTARRLAKSLISR
jgi:hypothetical protein